MTAKATITPAASGEIVFMQSGRWQRNTTTYNSNIVTMTINEAEPTPSPTPAVDYSAGVTVNGLRMRQLKEEKLMSFNIAITNGTQENYSNAVVSESILGNIETISTLQPGTTTVVYEQAYTDSATYVFKVVATAPDGAQIKAKRGCYGWNGETGLRRAGTFTSLGTILIIAAILVILIIATIVLIVFVKKGKEEAAAAIGNRILTEGSKSRGLLRAEAQRQPPGETGSRSFPYLDEEDEREASKCWTKCWLKEERRDLRGLIWRMWKSPPREEEALERSCSRGRDGCRHRGQSRSIGQSPNRSWWSRRNRI